MLSSNKNLIKTIDHHISEQCYTWNMLDDTDKELLVAEAMHGLGNEAYVCLTESDELGEILKDLRKHLLTGNNMHDLAASMIRAVTLYFTTELAALFVERKEAYDYDTYYENGFLPVVNKQTGEREWGRSL